MTMRLHTTRQGKVIQLLALDDLSDVVTGGTRVRACCPIHGGDHQRSLSIDTESGWGYCHCCHATVLVEPFNRNSSGERYASRSFVRESHHPTDTTHSGGYSYSHGLSRTPSVQPTWQQEEQTALTTLAPLLRSSLLTSRRVQSYLEERGIPLALAQGSGLGYLSRGVWEQVGASLAAEQHARLRRWVGRLLFPLHAPDGCGFIGRTLVGWQSGMDENAHKAVLEQSGMPRRWIKTNPAGWFGFAEPARLAATLILVEGGFDRLALLAAGIPASSVIALVGTVARSAWLVQHAPQVKRVILALDADTGGTAAMERLSQEFARAGIATTCCPPSSDRYGKDWNERYRRLGPQSVSPLYEVLAFYLLPRVSLAQPDASLSHPAEKGGDE
jgi:DNA primase